MHDLVRVREVARLSIPIFEKAIATYPDSIELRVEFAGAIDDNGDHDRAVNYIIDLVRQLPGWRDSTYFRVYYNAACLLSKNNKMLDLAVDYLDSAMAHSNDYDYRSFATSDPDMDNMRNLPRFRKIMYGR
jgi:tetratricopeptide (TPR) repeat protein